MMSFSIRQAATEVVGASSYKNRSSMTTIRASTQLKAFDIKKKDLD